MNIPRRTALERHTRLALHGHVERGVRLAAAAIEHRLHLRRLRLKETLALEQSQYESEWAIICSHEAKQKREDDERRIVELETKAERERLEVVETKMLQRKMSDCEQARKILMKKSLDQTKQDQKWQMMEKEAMREVRREEDKIYHELLVKRVEEETKKEDERKKREWLQKKENKANYLQQLHWKMKDLADKGEEKFRDQERIRADERLSKVERDKELAERREKMKKVAQDLKYSLVQDQRLREMKRKEEEALDKQCLTVAQQALEKEREAALKKKLNQQRDMKDILQHTENVRRQRDKAERDFASVIEEWYLDKEKQKDEDRGRVKEARNKLMTSVIRGREVQVQEKLERYKSDKEEQAREVKKVVDEVARVKIVEEDEARRAMVGKQLYGAELRRQMESNQERKKQERAEDVEYLQALQAAEAERLQQVAEVARLPLQCEVHPTLRAILATQTPNYGRPLPFASRAVRFDTGLEGAHHI